MKAFILCAGLGTRLRPLTNKLPKPAVPLLNEPIVFRVMSFLENNGIEEFIVNLHYLSDKLKQLIEGSHYDVRFSVEEKILGTAGALPPAAGELTSTFLLVNGDGFYRGSIGKAIEFHRQNDVLSTLLLTDYREGYSPVMVNQREKKVEAIGQEKDGCWKKRFTGIHILNKDILNYIPQGKKVCINDEVYKKLLKSKRGKISYFPYNRDFFDLGTRKRYLYAQKKLLERKKLSRLTDSGCNIPPSAELKASVLEDDVRVEEGAVVKNSAVMRGSVIGKDVKIESSIVSPDSEVKTDLDSKII